MEPKFKYAYKTQGSEGWEQIAFEMSDGSTIFIDLWQGRFRDSFWMDTEGKIHASTS